MVKLNFFGQLRGQFFNLARELKNFIEVFAKLPNENPLFSAINISSKILHKKRSLADGRFYNMQVARSKNKSCCVRVSRHRRDVLRRSIVFRFGKTLSGNICCVNNNQNFIILDKLQEAN